MDRKYYQKSKRGEEKGRERGSKSGRGDKSAIQSLAQLHERPKKQCHIEDAPWNTKRNPGLIVISGQTAKSAVALQWIVPALTATAAPSPFPLDPARRGAARGWELAALLYPPRSGEAPSSSSLWQVNWISFSKACSQLQEVLGSQRKAQGDILGISPVPVSRTFKAALSLFAAWHDTSCGWAVSVASPSSFKRALEVTAVVLLLPLFPSLLIK